MHDFDRIALENEFAAYENEGDLGGNEAEAFGYEGENDYEFGYEGEENFGDFESGEYGYELEGEGDHESDYEGDYEAGNGSSYETQMYAESPFSEAEEMALASELLSSSNEAELEEFLGDLLKKAGGALGKFLSSGTGQQLAGILKGAAKTALPILGGAAGNFLIPGVGGVMGSKLASAAGSMLGLELEGLSYEDQEFEVARQLVRFGGAAAANAADLEASTHPEQAATAGAVTAAKTYAPGLLRPQGAAQMSYPEHPHRRRRPRSGQWFRSGHRIMLVGV